jgi:hypothetical protein
MTHVESLLKARYQEVTKRLRNPSIRPVVPEIERLAAVPAFPKLQPIKPSQQPPMWKLCAISFDAHVIAYRQWKVTDGLSMRRYIAKRAESFGFTIHEIRGSGRKAELVSVRQMLMWEVRKKFGKSYTEIGRIFNKDHTCVLGAYRKFEGGKVRAIGT